MNACLALVLAGVALSIWLAPKVKRAVDRIAREDCAECARRHKYHGKGAVS